MEALQTLAPNADGFNFRDVLSNALDKGNTNTIPTGNAPCGWVPFLFRPLDLLRNRCTFMQTSTDPSRESPKAPLQMNVCLTFLRMPLFVIIFLRVSVWVRKYLALLPQKETKMGMGMSFDHNVAPGLRTPSY